jgi:hypothetical protein
MMMFSSRLTSSTLTPLSDIDKYPFARIIGTDMALVTLCRVFSFQAKKGEDIGRLVDHDYAYMVK